MHSNKPTEVDSMNLLRVQAEDKARLYRRALEFACNGDSDQVAYFVSEAGTAIDEEHAALGVKVCPACGVALHVLHTVATGAKELVCMQASCASNNAGVGKVPHHCAPEDIDALLRWLDAIGDPQQEALPSLKDTDWRGRAGVIARVIRHLRGPDGVPVGPAAKWEPSEAQISAALEAANHFDTAESRKDMRRALLAAAGIVPPGQEWKWPNGIPGAEACDPLETVQRWTPEHDGMAHDEEGGQWVRLEDVRRALGVTVGVPACACGDIERQGWVHRQSYCWPHEENAPGVPGTSNTEEKNHG